MNKILSLLILLILFSCEKRDINKPSYISIKNIYLDSTETYNITDAWIYIDDNLQGVYELPAHFPILSSGTHKLRVKAGIKKNGIASSRIAYPFYTSYIIDEYNFESRTTIEVNPSVESLYSNDSIFIEDFDGSGLSLETDSSTFSIENFNSIDGNYGTINLVDSVFLSEITTNKLENLPQQGADVYLELDYKCDTDFLIGVYINFPGGVVKKELQLIYPQAEWNKIYIDLTQTISEGIGAESFKVFIGANKGSTLETKKIYLDNLKVVFL
ncbi:MAG: hypothetical protein CMD16_01450 [Flavobacteriales bacterium]|nr:hypothetical protein [Flavobacteriales bacterium]|tara:strand:- start:7993 stop:8805 length:813 start_codon:yes stop_codon:yes gene_type:complete